MCIAIKIYNKNKHNRYIEVFQYDTTLFISAHTNVYDVSGTVSCQNNHKHHHTKNCPIRVLDHIDVVRNLCYK